MIAKPAAFIDTHFHAGADIHPRRTTLVTAAAEYAELGGAVWIKRHDGETVSATERFRRQGQAVGGVAVLQPRHFEDVVALQDLLKRAAGRLRPIVTLPTQWVADFLDAAATRSGRLAFEMLATVLAAGDAALATGHVPARHLPRLLRDVAGVLAGVPVIVTHAFHPMIEGGDVADELRDMFDVYLEHTELTRRLERISEEQHQRILCEQDRLIYASDFGQIGSPTVAAWRNESRIMFDSLGLDADRCYDITLGNAWNALVRASEGAPARP